MVATKDSRAIIAVNRFGLGAAGRELVDAKHDPQQWLLQQLVNPVFDKTLGDTESAFKVIAEIKAYKQRRRQTLMQGPKVGEAIIKPYRQRLLMDSLERSVQTTTPFAMRLMDFFSNHFSVSASTQPLTILSPTLERDAIAPNLFGQFADLLIAVEQHPAMLIYLNNEKSVGPNSPRGKTARGLNENLAREIFELHTLGVDKDYTLDDIKQLAMVISGWSVSDEQDTLPAGFRFRNKSHEPGTRRILGKSYPDKGLAQGEAVLRDLAGHRKTAEFISYKLAQHLIADKPPKELVAAMRDTWLKTDGNIKAVVSTLVKHPASWDSQRQKFKTPREFVVSACRAVNQVKPTGESLLDEGLVDVALRGLGFMGQKPFGAGSPAGYSQLNRAWMGSDALMKRIDWVNLLVKKTRATAPFVANRIFASQLSSLTGKTLAGAESRVQGLALLLLSPEFHSR
jgi:uncharacterized protein (DUF1800 family)